ncbi:MAG: hypothetical protein JSW66_16280 [Phycisphaerales bacterium]|nr:MAG: hypothetical protein JSW66_16280 [Phycisphaerales bacterium]
MILPRPIRKILAIFRGSVSPVLIFLSITLGFWFGLVPGWSGFHTAVVAAVFVLNVHLGLFLLSAGIAKSLCLAAAPVFFYIGQGVQDHLPGLLKVLAAIPIVGITDFSNYSVSGAIVVGPIIGGIIGLLMAQSVISFRRMLLKLEEGSEQFKKWYSRRWVRILDRLLIGKRTKDAKSLFTGKTKIIRKAGVAIAAVILLVSAGAIFLTKGDVTRNYAATTLTRVNGAEVNIESLDLSALTGAVSASGIQVTDAKEPQNNQVAIGKIAADTSLYHLLLGKVFMENVEVSDVRFNQKRDTAGKVVETGAQEVPSTFDPCDYKVTAADISKLETYFKDAKALKKKLQKVRQWLPKAEGGDTAQPQAQQVPLKYLDYLVARASVPPSPRMMAKKVLLDKVQTGSPLFGSSQILMTNISDSVQTVGLPVGLEMKSLDTEASVNVTADYSTAGGVPEISGAFGGLDLSKMQSSLSGSRGLMFESGIASGKFQGQLTSELIDLTLDVAVRDMKARAGEGGVLGLDSKTASEALAVLNNLQTQIRIVGPVTEPRLVFDVKGLESEFKEALVRAGKEKLASEIDKQIDEQLDKQLGDEVPEEVKDVVDQSKELLKGLLGGKEDK